MAGILLARHLRQRALTSQGTQVCINPVPSGIYRIFLASTSTPPPDAPEETLQRSDAPAIGMREEDAAGFCEWANDALSHQATYRLPRSSELEELTRQQRIPALADGYHPHTSPTFSTGNSPTQQSAAASSARQTDPPIRVDSIADHLISDPGLSLGLLLIDTWVWASLLAQTSGRNLSSNLVHLNALAVARVNELAHALAFERGRTPVVANTDVLEIARNLAHALANALTLADAHAEINTLGNAHALVDSLTNARDLALGLNHDGDLANVPDFVRGLVLDLNRDLDRAHNLDRDLAYARDLPLLRTRTRDLDRDLVYTLVSDLSLDLARASDLAFRLALRPAQSSLLLSVVRVQEIGHVVAEASQFDQSTIDTCKRLVAGSVLWTKFENSNKTSDASERDGEARVTYSLSGQPLSSEAATKATAALVRTLRAHKDADTLIPWVSAISARLEDRVTTIFDRREPATPEAAAEIRLMAVCLAAEADAVGYIDIGNRFLAIAAEITWLERRRSGAIEAREVIMLAVE